METYGRHEYPGRLFIVEGVDGSGKSTQIALLRQWLISEGYTVFFSEWNSSPLVKKTTSRGKKKQLLTPTTFSLIHATVSVGRTYSLYCLKRETRRGTVENVTGREGKLQVGKHLLCILHSI